MFFAQSAPRHSPTLQPSAQQWSHTVPTMMPWADPTQQFMRFQSQPAGFAAQPQTYVLPGDPCTSKGCENASPPPPPYQSPSTSYCIVRSKRKMRQDLEEPIACKQLITEKMVEQMNGLSIGDCQLGSSGAAVSSGPDLEEYDSDIEQTLIMKEELKKYVVAPTVEDRLAMEMRKKSTMAIIPWSPPKPLACFKDEDEKKPQSVESTDSMEM